MAIGYSCFVAKKPASAAASGPLTAEHRIVVLVGKDPFLQGEYTAALKEALIKQHGEIDTFRFDGPATTAAAVLDECRTFGLMQQHKLVVVDAADQLVKEENRPLMERYAAAPCESATLVLRCDKWNKGKLDALIEAVGVIKQCEALTAQQAAAWAGKRCQKRHNATIQPVAARMLVDRLGTELGKIDMELAKLAAHVGSEPGKPGTITTEAVEQMVGMGREEEVWVVQSTLLSAGPEQALACIRDALDVSRHHPTLVTYACLDLARKLHGAARGLKAGANPWQLAGKLRLWGDSKDAILAAAGRADPVRMSALFREAVEADRRQKTGQADPVRSLEALALRFAHAFGRG